MEAIAQGNIIVVTGKPSIGKPQLHAEMRILHHLITHNLISKSTRYYLGVAKKCCPQCDAPVRAVSQLYEAEIAIRGTHDTLARAAIPKFLFTNQNLQGLFLKALAVRGLQFTNYVEAFKPPKPSKGTNQKQTFTPSTSAPGSPSLNYIESYNN